MKTNKTKIVLVRFTEEENKALIKVARKKGYVDKSKFIRALCQEAIK